MSASTKKYRTPEEWWRACLTGEIHLLREGRGFNKFLPSPPRCKLCPAPFAGIGGAIMRLRGRAPWPKKTERLAVRVLRVA